MDTVNQKPLIILTGPTAVGKTDLSIRLAKAVGGEIISADSMQIYKYMDIGTAKITPEQMQGVPHYLIDTLMPDEPFNVVIFQKMAKAAMEKIYAAGHIPMLVGGTGFYIQSVLYDIDFEDNDNDMEYRHFLEAACEKNGPLWLHSRLEAVDPQSAAEIHANNVKKVIRALEYYHKTGQKISEHNRIQRMKPSPYRFVYFVLEQERKTLYERIEKRIDQMLSQGLVDEVGRLLDMGYSRDLVSMQGLGYKEIIDYLQGRISFDEAVYILKRDTRHFAKRQMTWFRRERDVCYIQKEQYPDEEHILEAMLAKLSETHII